MAKPPALKELARLALRLRPLLPLRVNEMNADMIVTSQSHPFLLVTDAFHRQTLNGSAGDPADLVTLLNALPQLLASQILVEEARSAGPVEIEGKS